MSERVDSGGGSVVEPYSPFERTDLARGNGILVEFFFLLVALGGLSLQGGLFGAAAWLLLLACWATLRVEFTFGVGAVLFTGLTGVRSGFAEAVAVAVGSGLEVSLVAIAVTLTGLGGLLANDLRHTWRSIRPVALFVVLVGFSAAVLALASRGIALQRLGAGTVVTLVLSSYVLHRYERGRRWRVESAEAERETDVPRSEDG
jgi:hypothetical protein